MKVSVLSVEPWLVEPGIMGMALIASSVSVLSVEPWLVEPFHGHVVDVSVGCFSALSRAVVGGTKAPSRLWPRAVLFQCSQSSRGWWNHSHTRHNIARVCSFSALSRAVVGGTGNHGNGAHRVVGFSALSRAVVGGTKRRTGRLQTVAGFSALSRAVVGGTLEHGVIVQPCKRFSALSRAVVGGTLCSCLTSMVVVCVSVLSVEPWLVERHPR